MAMCAKLCRMNCSGTVKLYANAVPGCGAATAKSCCGHLAIPCQSTSSLAEPVTYLDLVAQTHLLRFTPVYVTRGFLLMMSARGCCRRHGMYRTSHQQLYQVCLLSIVSGPHQSLVQWPPLQSRTVQ
jgi:hypothetical protein